VSVAVFLKYAHEYCPVRLKLLSFELIVTHAQANVTCPAPNCSKFIIVHTANATDAFVGIVRVIAAALVNVITLPASPITKVYVVPV
jgi:hypothetical protein